MFIKPAPGLKIRDPVSNLFLTDAGKEVSDTDQYWNRRIADGDVFVFSAAPVLQDLQITDSHDSESRTEQDKE